MLEWSADRCTLTGDLAQPVLLLPSSSVDPFQDALQLGVGKPVNSLADLQDRILPCLDDFGVLARLDQVVRR